MQKLQNIAQSFYSKVKIWGAWMAFSPSRYATADNVTILIECLQIYIFNLL